MNTWYVSEPIPLITVNLKSELWLDYKVLCTSELMHAMTVNLKSELRLIIRMFRVSEFLSVNKHMVHQRAEAWNRKFI